MSTTKLCPKCGKPMQENPNWEGMWMCPDSVKAINDSPPFRYVCTGKKITRKGYKALEDALNRKYLEKLRESN